MSFSMRQVTLRAGVQPLFEGFSISVAAGEVVTLMGPSGVGKSSLLAWACGARLPGISGAGKVLVDGQEVSLLPAHRRRIGVLFQDDMLFPHMSVGDNLAFGYRGPRSERQVAIASALDEAELPGMSGRNPATLSGGQRARVALMRVLLSRPRALLLDEPFSRLDASLRARFRAMVLATAGTRALPVLLVTHDAADAAGQVVKLESPG